MKQFKIMSRWRTWLVIGLVFWLIGNIIVGLKNNQRLIASKAILSSKSDQSVVLINWQRLRFWKLENLNLPDLKLTLVTTDKSRKIGLGGQKELSNDGMFFIFDQSAKWQFWMKDMVFPLDFIWLNNGTVAEITEAVPALIPGNDQAASPVFGPKYAVNQVIELPAGKVKTLGIKIGDKIVILK